MPELPEVETVRRVMRRALQGKRIAEVEVVPDEIVLAKVEPEVIAKALKGAKVNEVGRRGKFWWLELDRTPWLFGHLGMSGWIRELGQHTIRLKEHGSQPLDDETGRPRFLKLLLQAEDGTQVAFTDGRRLGRLWLADDPASDERVRELGPDALDELPKVAALQATLGKRKAPIKAILMDQGLFPGIGNWVADEVLYHAKIAPQRAASSLESKEIERLRKAILSVLQTAVDAGADSDKYPKDWLFHHRWGGDRGKQEVDGRTLIREKIGGRTTAWVPELQK
jgi:formamidopyrimidine-DNA glycosylase